MTKLNIPLDGKALIALDNVAAGHEGVMSDADGLLVIKPCTQAEVAFYESAAASHAEFAAFMPTFMGTLRRGRAGEDDPKSTSASTAATLTAKDAGPMHGKALDTDLCIVLENIAAGFEKPNILDVKLGARLWDDDAPLAKRARLDDVAAKTTSSSLGFRIAGMQVWRPDRSDEASADKQRAGEAPAEGGPGDGKQGLWSHDHETHYSKYNKMYGRSFSADNKHEGFQEYLGLQEFLGLGAPGSAPDPRHNERADELLDYFMDQVRAIQEVLEKEESRMYSASILFVYEGDLGAYHKSKQQLTDANAETGGEDDGEDDGDDDEKSGPKLAAVKMIDFAHAKWAPGEGPDENVLQGVRGVIEMFKRVRNAFEPWGELGL